MNTYKDYSLRIIFALIIMLFCLLSQLGVYYVFADSSPTIIESGTIDNITYTLDDEGLFYFSGSGQIPDSFSNNVVILPDLIKTINIEEGITGIGPYAFQSYSSLETVILADSVVSIGGSAFSFCTSLTNINLHDNITYIGANVFMNCTNLKTIKLPCNTDNISKYMFVSSNIENVQVCCDFDITTFYKSTNTGINSHDILFEKTDINVEIYNHKYKDWEVTKEPTYTTFGEKVKKCYCGQYTEVKQMDMLVQSGETEKEGLSVDAIIAIVSSILLIVLDIIFTYWLIKRQRKIQNINKDN